MAVTKFFFGKSSFSFTKHIWHCFTSSSNKKKATALYFFPDNFVFSTRLVKFFQVIFLPWLQVMAALKSCPSKSVGKNCRGDVRKFPGIFAAYRRSQNYRTEEWRSSLLHRYVTKLIRQHFWNRKLKLESIQ